jgi:hypothetical protein
VAMTTWRSGRIDLQPPQAQERPAPQVPMADSLSLPIVIV